MIDLRHGDCLQVLKELPDTSVQCVITSPPYYGLRDYGTATWKGGDPNCTHRRETKKSDRTITGHKNFDEMLGVSDAIQKSVCSYCGAIRIDQQVGLEQTPQDYVNRLVEIFRECKRVLRDDGTLWLNLGDSYAAHKDCKSIGQTLAAGTNREHAHEIDKGRSRTRDSRMLKEEGYKNKDLIGIPWMVAFALRADGWYLRSDIIWAKPNPMPESVKDRPTKSHEYIFLLTKSEKYYYDYESVLEPAAYDGRKDTMFKGAVKDYSGTTPEGTNPQTFATEGHERWPYKVRGFKTKEQIENPQHHGNDILTELPGRNKRSVWWVSTKPYREAHFATFPEALIEPCVLAGTKAGDTILDPFNGAGTTGVVALKNGRRYIGIELNEKYIEMTKKRLEKITQPIEGIFA